MASMALWQLSSLLKVAELLPNPLVNATPNSGPLHAGKTCCAQSALPARSVPPLAAAQHTRWAPEIDHERVLEDSKHQTEQAVC